MFDYFCLLLCFGIGLMLREQGLKRLKTWLSNSFCDEFLGPFMGQNSPKPPVAAMNNASVAILLNFEKKVLRKEIKITFTFLVSSC